MNKRINFSDTDLERANHVDLEYFLIMKGEPLEKSGRDKRLKSDPSITIKGNKWYDHSAESGGCAISFVRKFYGLDFPTAVCELLGRSNFAYPSYIEPPKEVKPFILPNANNNRIRLNAYLTKHRGIDSSVLNVFVNRNLIYESREEFGYNTINNAVFVGLNADGVPKHAHKRSIYSHGKKFVQNIAGSQPQYSFNFRGNSDRLYVFEAPIDMLSFISRYSNCNWQSHNYVALCGISSQAMLTQLDTNHNLRHVVLCLDNDQAGQQARERFAKLLDNRGITHSQLIPKLKDFNEDLVAELKKFDSTMLLALS